jgi:hypothetical protein
MNFAKVVRAPLTLSSAERRVSQYDWKMISCDLSDFGCARKRSASKFPTIYCPAPTRRLNESTDVRFWHKADIRVALGNVRFCG